MNRSGIVSDYLHCALTRDRVKYIIENILEIVANNKLEFDSIAFRGISGGLIAPVAAFKLKKELIVIRKNEETNHSSYSAEGNKFTEKYIIIDDCIESGDTVNSIHSEVKELSKDSNCVGIILYDSISDGKEKFVTSDSISVNLYHISYYSI